MNLASAIPADPISRHCTVVSLGHVHNLISRAKINQTATPIAITVPMPINTGNRYGLPRRIPKPISTPCSTSTVTIRPIARCSKCIIFLKKIHNFVRKDLVLMPTPIAIPISAIDIPVSTNYINMPKKTPSPSKKRLATINIIIPIASYQVCVVFLIEIHNSLLLKNKNRLTVPSIIFFNFIINVRQFHTICL